jgi:lysozyme family protein
MTQISFDMAFEHVIEVEGKYSNDPKDPGGETMFGICKRDHPNVDIKNLTIEKAKSIYKKEYWDTVCCDSLPSPLNLFVFDCAVNQGTSTSTKLLQAALRVTVDGDIGAKTLSAASASGNYGAALFMTERVIRYTKTKNADTYLNGWLNRLFVTAMKFGNSGK